MSKDVCPRLSGSNSWSEVSWRRLSGEISKSQFFFSLLFIQATKSNGRNCRGKLRDFVLDWEAELPQEVIKIQFMIAFFQANYLLVIKVFTSIASAAPQDLDMSDTHSMQADLSIVLGSTLQVA